MNIRKKLAIQCAKFISKIIQILSPKSGNTFPGYVARLIDPEILPYLSGMVHEKIIVIIGTNGKTTTNSLLCHALRIEGKAVLSNQTGANMLNGIVSAFVLATNKKEEINADYACIEVDELTAIQVLPQLNPDCILLTNIFRDQLDRFGELDIILDKIRATLSALPQTKLIINCDDFLSATLGCLCQNSVTTYGINQQIFDPVVHSSVRESIFCRFCGEKLEYDFFHYGQLGSYHCPKCRWCRPLPDYTTSEIIFQHKAFSFNIRDIHIDSNAGCPYNVYNTLAAYTVLKAADAPTDNFKNAVETFDYSNGREEIFTINSARVQLHLAKNPIGFQQKLSLILTDKACKDIIIQINDCPQDGKDVSWLWDVDFSYLKDANTATIATTGTRRYDMALRLKYEDILCQPARSLRRMSQKFTTHGTGNLYIIVNYSSLLSTNRMLKKMQKKFAAQK